MSLTHPVAALAGLALLSATTAYSVLTCVAVEVWRLRGTRRRTATPRPPVTVLKPLCGAEPGLYENLRSFCLQDYPALQLIFGVRDAADPALAVVRRLVEEFRSLPIDIVIDASQHGSNRKVSNLMNMLPRATHDLLIISDSDAVVGPDYLSTVTAPLLNPKNGLVTCIYQSVPTTGVWSRLGAMYINDWYMPSVLLAWLFGHRDFASGQTMGLRRDTLEAMGGLSVIADHLADDYELGQQVRKLGLRLVLSPYLLETVQDEPDPAALIAHELRWMRTIRVLAPAGFTFLFLSFTLPLAAVGIALTAAEPAVASTALKLFCITLAARLGLSCIPRLAHERLSFADLWLLPLRDLLLCWVWWRAFFTSRVTWRGSKFIVDAHGVMRIHS
jgi:ceramide glucosyltransferase